MINKINTKQGVIFKNTIKYTVEGTPKTKTFYATTKKGVKLIAERFISQVYKNGKRT